MQKKVKKKKTGKKDFCHQGSQGIREYTINICSSSPMMIIIITPYVG